MTPARKPEIVPAPSEPFRGLLITWPLRQIRDGIRVPHPRDRSDDWAWEYEHRFGVGSLLDRRDLLCDAFTRLRRQKIDSARLAERLTDVKRNAAMAYIDINGRAARRLRDREAARIEKQARRWLQRLIEMHQRVYMAVDPTEEPNSSKPYRVALEALSTDYLFRPRTGARNARGNPNARVIQESRRSLRALGIANDDCVQLLEAVGLL